MTTVETTVSSGHTPSREDGSRWIRAESGAPFFWTVVMGVFWMIVAVVVWLVMH